MNAMNLVTAVQELGIKLTTSSDGKLLASPKGKLPPALKAQLSAHKAAVLELLERQAAAQEVALQTPPPCSECGRTDWAISLVDDEGARRCVDCLIGRTALRRMGAPA